MNKYAAATLVALPVLAASGLLYMQTTAEAKTNETQQVSEAGYVCPATGEVLPCEKCCPLNK
ncbi:MAG: hypothetical protein WD851_17880 [Pirellulales bacterium]